MYTNSPESGHTNAFMSVLKRTKNDNSSFGTYFDRIFIGQRSETRRDKMRPQRPTGILKQGIDNNLNFYDYDLKSEIIRGVQRTSKR